MADIWTPLPLPFPIPLPYSGKGGDAQSGAKASAESALRSPSAQAVSLARCVTLLTPAGALLSAAPGRMEYWKNLAIRLGGGEKHPALHLLIWSSFDETEKKLE